MKKKPPVRAEQLLSRDEIESRYNGEWVLLGNLELDRQERVKRAQVLAHSPRKDAVVRAGTKVGRKSVALLWMGQRPRLAVIL